MQRIPDKPAAPLKAKQKTSRASRTRAAAEKYARRIKGERKKPKFSCNV